MCVSAFRHHCTQTHVLWIVSGTAKFKPRGLKFKSSAFNHYAIFWATHMLSLEKELLLGRWTLYLYSGLSAQWSKHGLDFNPQLSLPGCNSQRIPSPTLPLKSIHQPLDEITHNSVYIRLPWKFYDAAWTNAHFFISHYDYSCHIGDSIFPSSSSLQM